MRFQRFDDAMRWAKIYGRENCRPCDKWEIVRRADEYMVAILFKASGKFVGYAI